MLNLIYNFKSKNMKKVFLSVIAMVAFVAVSSAQDTKFGVKGGINLASLGADADDADGVTSFYIGGLVDITVSEKFHVQPELLYSSEGAEDAEISFIRIPIMAKFYVGEGFNLQAGPTIGIKAGADDGMDEMTKSLDYGLGIGAAYELAGGLFFDARYNFGLANISDIDGIDVTTNTIQVGLGFRF